jgi:hypothetical protein
MTSRIFRRAKAAQNKLALSGNRVTGTRQQLTYRDREGWEEEGEEKGEGLTGTC